MQKKLLIFLGVFLMSLFADEVQVEESQAKDIQKVRLETSSVSTGIPLESDIAKIPGSVSVVDSKHLHKATNTSVYSVMSSISGVHIDDNAGFRTRPKVRIRGMSYGTLLMLDGVILSDLEGEARILSQLSLYDIERVEVAKGAYSSLYGAGAIGGVIHFITSMPEKLELQAIAGYGNEIQKDTADKNIFRFYGSIGDVFFDKRLKIKLSAGFTTTDGYSNHPSYLSSTHNDAQNALNQGAYKDAAGQVILGTGGNRAVQSYDISFKSSYEAGERDEVGLNLRLSNHNYDFKNYKTNMRDANGNPTFLVNGNNYFISGWGGWGDYTHLIGSLSYLHSFDESQLKVTLSSMNLFSWWIDGAGWGVDTEYGKQTFNDGKGLSQDIDSSSNYLDIVYVDSHLSEHTITLGAQARYYTYAQKQRDMTNWRDYNSRTSTRIRFGTNALAGAVYANVDSLWVDSAKFGSFGSSIGLRYDYWYEYNGYFASTTENNENLNNSVSILSPKLALIYTPLDIQEHSLRLKTSVGRGFRMPALRQKYEFGGTDGYIVDINKDLKYEHTINAEIGVEYDTSVLRTSLYFYNLEMFDMIYKSGAGSQKDPYRSINAGRGRINGIEFDINIPIWRTLELQANYTLTNARILKNPTRPQTQGKRLLGLPLHTLNVGLNYLPQYGFFGSLHLHYAPASYHDDINSPIIQNAFGRYDTKFAFNAKLGYTFKNNIELCAQFLNITNNRYYDFYRVAGASYYLQIAYKL